jgi:hypothetical protein
LQSCLAPSAAALSIGIAESLAAAVGAASDDGIEAVVAGSIAGGVEPPQATAPPRMPVIAALISELDRVIE